MDVFVEQIVRKSLTTMQKTLRVITWCVGFFTSIIFILMGLGAGVLAPVFLGIAAISVFLAHKITKNLHIEYEYSVTNNIIDVDKITAKTHRQRLLSTKIFEFENFGEYKQSDHEQKPYQNVIFAAVDEKNPYFAIFNLKGKGRTLLVFNPNDKILSAINKHIHPKLRKRAD